MIRKTLIAAAFLVSALSAQAEVVEAVLARVGDRIITRTQYLTRLNDGLREIERTTPPEELAARKQAYQDDLLDEMLAEVLIKDRADRMGITVTNQELQEAVQRLMQQYNLADEAAFERSLQQSGLTRTDMEARLRDTLTTNKVFSRELRSRTEISDRELRQRYDREKDQYRLPERAKLREIVVVVPPGADSATRVQAMAESQEAATRARAGEVFSTLATEYSDAPTKDQGGDIGTISKGELLAVLDEAVFATPQGGIAGPVETPAGYHVILVEERIASEVPGFEAVRDRLRREADDETFQRDYEAYIERLRGEAYVQVFEKNIPAV